MGGREGGDGERGADLAPSVELRLGTTIAWIDDPAAGGVMKLLCRAGARALRQTVPSKPQHPRQPVQPTPRRQLAQVHRRVRLS